MMLGVFFLGPQLRRTIIWMFHSGPTSLMFKWWSYVRLSKLFVSTFWLFRSIYDIKTLLFSNRNLSFVVISIRTPVNASYFVYFSIWAIFLAVKSMAVVLLQIHNSAISGNVSYKVLLKILRKKYWLCGFTSCCDLIKSSEDQVNTKCSLETSVIMRRGSMHMKFSGWKWKRLTLTDGTQIVPRIVILLIENWTVKHFIKCENKLLWKSKVFTLTT